MRMFARRRTALSVNLLTDGEYQNLKAMCPHDVEVDLATWAAYLSCVLGRTIGEDAALPLITEYNTRLRQEYA